MRKFSIYQFAVSLISHLTSHIQHNHYNYILLMFFIYFKT